MIGCDVQGASDRCDNHVLRSALGLVQFRLRHYDEDRFPHALFGHPQSLRRDQFIEQSERRLGVSMNQSQRRLLRQWQWNLLVCRCAPGAGQTTIILVIILQVRVAYSWKSMYYIRVILPLAV